MGFLRKHARRHSRFYVAALLGVLSWFLMGMFAPALRYAVAGDMFFIVYMILMVRLAFETTPVDLRNEAKTEDEGIILILILTFAAIVFSLTSIFTLLNRARGYDSLRVTLSVASAPLGWFMLHTLAAFHYAHRYYLAERGGLKFPDTGEPGIWDFVYHSFVIGMTGQVSDVQVVSAPMRQLTLGHSIVSFFYNTVLIALAINVVVILA
jgi:uncharacterized membrane protein